MTTEFKKMVRKNIFIVIILCVTGIIIPLIYLRILDITMVCAAGLLIIAFLAFELLTKGRFYKPNIPEKESHNENEVVERKGDF